MSAQYLGPSGDVTSYVSRNENSLHPSGATYPSPTVAYQSVHDWHNQSFETKTVLSNNTRNVASANCSSKPIMSASM